MNTKTNISLANEDSRSVQRIIFEKANFGAVPTFFRVEGDNRLHPIQWTKHPHLIEVLFSDGSTSRVTASYDPEIEAQVMSQFKGSGDKDLVANGDDIPWTVTGTDVTDSAIDDLRDMVDDGMKMAYASPLTPTGRQQIDTPKEFFERVQEFPKATRAMSEMEAIKLGLRDSMPKSEQVKESFKAADFAPILDQNLEERN